MPVHSTKAIRGVAIFLVVISLADDHATWARHLRYWRRFIRACVPVEAEPLLVSRVGSMSLPLKISSPSRARHDPATSARFSPNSSSAATAVAPSASAMAAGQLAIPAAVTHLLAPLAER